jgi:hypothetical protein
MPGENSLAKLQTRKRLLLLEAVIHRAELRQDWGDMKDALANIEEKTKPARSFLKLAGFFVAGLSAVRGIRRGGRASFFPPLLKLLTGTVLPVFLRFAMRPRLR